MQGIKLVTFDATNTLLKFRVPPWQYYSIVAKEYGFIGTPELLKTQMKNSFKYMEQKHPNFGRNDITWQNWWRKVVKLTFQGQLPDNANVDQIADKLIDDFKTTRCWTTADGTQKLLDLVKRNKTVVGVLSNFDPRLVDILQNVNLYNKFDFVTTSYQAGYSKPDRRIFDEALRYYSFVQPSECLHIGDDVEKDYKGAKAAGWHALLVASAGEAQASADHVFKSIPDLTQALEQNRIQLQRAN